MKIVYKNWNPRQDTLNLVNVAEQIIKEYQSNGFVLTLRQLYYQFVSRGIIDNSDRSYKNLGGVITKARLAGLISWEAIEDRNREYNSFWYNEDETTVIRDLPHNLRFDRWARQDYYIEVWVEKEALGNVVARSCNQYFVPYMACKGYLSSSEAWRAGQRFYEKLNQGKQCILIHLGDHDPSGIDMTRDNKERLDLFTKLPEAVRVNRIALNMNQVEQYKPPPNPAKITDTRAKDYIKKFGKTSWELDALEPQLIEKLIQDEIKQYIDFNIWQEAEKQEASKRALLVKLYENWEDISQFLNN